MGSQKIEWDKLYKERTVKIYPAPIIERKQLPEGVYLCPECLGDGKVIDIHRMFGKHTYRKCPMCSGIGEIRKCDVCKENPIPNGDEELIRCIFCFEKHSAERIEDFNKRVRESQLEGADL